METDFLRRLPLFAGLSDADLEKLVDMADRIELPAGAVLMEEGTAGDALYLALDGEFEVTKRSGNSDVVISRRGGGEILGEISLLDNSPRSATVRATKPTRLLKISRESFLQLLQSSPSATLAIIHTITSRLRTTESMVRQNEKMAALGTLSAGLAHELNNPAAAARRSADQLRETIAEWLRLASARDELHLNDTQLHAIGDLRDEIFRRVAAPAQLDAITRSDRESRVQEWLEGRGVEDAWEAAPTLVNFNWTVEDFERLCVIFPDQAFPILAKWIAAGCMVYSLLDEVRLSAERISEIVKAVKEYSYLDQAPIQEVDIHKGLENTLVILRHKLKQGVKVNREYAPDLPHIEGYGSELNQAWTNIVDNAIDAMHEQGAITLRTRREGEDVVVEICDTGPGIPAPIQQRIFEPFFTTKPPGEGTGLGLHITYNIIVNKHFGSIRVDSQPGNTCFVVTLPIRMRKQTSDN